MAAFKDDVALPKNTPKLLSPYLVTDLFVQNLTAPDVTLVAHGSDTVAPTFKGGLHLGYLQALDTNRPVASWQPQFQAGAFIWAFSERPAKLSVNHA